MRLLSNAIGHSPVTEEWPVGSSAPDRAARRSPRDVRAVWWGALGVLGFSFSLPATRLAVADLDPAVVGLGRAVVAAAFAAALLAVRREPVPARAPPAPAAPVGLRGVVGVPVFTAPPPRPPPSAPP